MKETVLYPSYIFIYMQLNEVTYRAIQTVQKVSSFVGPRKPIKGTYGMSQVVPKRLSDAEIKTFEGLSEACSVMSQKVRGEDRRRRAKAASVASCLLTAVPYNS